MNPHTLTEIVSSKNFTNDPLICVPVAPGEYPVFQAEELQPGFDDPDRQLFAEPKVPLGTRRHLKNDSSSNVYTIGPPFGPAVCTFLPTSSEPRGTNYNVRHGIIYNYSFMVHF